jgi:hypothetical protein
MKIHVEFDLALSTRQKRIVRASLVASVVIAVLGVGVAVAAPVNTFKDTDLLTAKAMNQNFVDLDARLSALDARVGTLEAFQSRATVSGAYSVGAKYCGKTASTPGNLSGLATPGAGYAKAKAACQVACGASTTAHMCTPEDLTRSAQVGTAIATGWFATGIWASYPTAGAVRDCLAWSTATSTDLGVAWDPALGPSGAAACNTSLAVLCCD